MHYYYTEVREVYERRFLLQVSSLHVVQLTSCLRCCDSKYRLAMWRHGRHQLLVQCVLCRHPQVFSRTHCSPKSTVPDFISSCCVRIGSGFLSQPTHPLHYCHHPVSCSSSLLSVSIIIPASCVASMTCVIRDRVTRQNWFSLSGKTQVVFSGNNIAHTERQP